jgi:uncharacterized membrane protein
LKRRQLSEYKAKEGSYQNMKQNSNGNSNVWMTTKRIETLVDGIFAIAMTLLVLSLNVPQIAYPATNAAILQSLAGMSQQFFIYVLSFVLLATFWRINHSQFYLIEKTDQTLLWINVMWLLLVALVPFSTNMVGDYGYLAVPMIFFDINLFLIGVFFNLNWHYAVKRKFLDESVDRRFIESRNKINLALPILALIAIGLTFITPEWSSVVYFGIFFIKRII